MRKPKYGDTIACSTLAGLIDGFEKAFKTPLCSRIEECLQAIDPNGGEYRAIEPTNEEVILQAPDVYVESLERLKECSCRKRTVLISYADDEVRSFFFCLRVQEYDFGKGAVEAGNAAIEYMESVPGIVPKKHRKAVYQGVLAAYLEDLASRGFERLYLKAEPPDIGEDYIFPGTSAARGNTSTVKDAVPDYSYLLRWYEEAFTFYQELEIISSFTNTFEHVQGLEDLVQIPLLDGDWILPEVLEEVFVLDRVVRTSERYAELFRAKMKERRHKAPYPDIYYVLFLANAKYISLPDNMTVTRKGIEKFCKANNHTFQTPASATAATNAILVELFLQFAQTHVKACASCESLRKQKQDADVLALTHALHGLSVNNGNAMGKSVNSKPDKGCHADKSDRPMTQKPPALRVRTNSEPSDIHTLRITRSMTTTIADRVRSRRAVSSERD